MEIIFIRHGESEGNSGQSHLWDSALSTIGRQQAERAAEAVRRRGIERIYCSPMNRAAHTGSLIGRALSCPVEAWVELAEHGLCWEEKGLSRSQLAEKYPNVELSEEIDEEGWARHWVAESREEQAERMHRVAQRLLGMAEAKLYRTAACVIHGKSGTELLKHLLGIDSKHEVYFHHLNCGITRLYIQENGIVNLLAMNETGHLKGLMEHVKPPMSAPNYR